MAKRSIPREEHWWLRRGPSLLVLVVVVALLGGAVFVLGSRVAESIPAVGKDKAGEDTWSDPIGVESVRGFQVGHIPDCAAGAVSRIVLWDEDAQDYWSVSGPATPMTTFSVGATPDGFETDTPLRKPPPGATLRLVVFRKGRPPAGIRFHARDLVDNRVMAGQPLQRFTVLGFQTADVCGTRDASTVRPGASSTTSIVGG